MGAVLAGRQPDLTAVLADAGERRAPSLETAYLAAREPDLAHLASASVQGLLSVGPRAGQRLVRLFGRAAGGDAPRPPARNQTPGYGFDLHARTRVPASDAKGRERLCRYLLRPPLAQDSLRELEDGRYELRLKRPWSDGTRAVVFEGPDLCAKLAVMVPPPRTHRTRFHGVFSSHARLRSRVVPRPKPADDTPDARHAGANAASTERAPGHSGCCDAPETPSDFTQRRRLRWASLMARVFTIDVLACPACGSRMVMVDFITEHHAIRRMLDAVGHPADSPSTPRRPAQTPRSA